VVAWVGAIVMAWAAWSEEAAIGTDDKFDGAEGDLGAFHIPVIRNTFLSVPNEEPDELSVSIRPRAHSSPPSLAQGGSMIDRYEREFHILMFKHRSVPDIPPGPSQAPSHKEIEAAVSEAGASTTTAGGADDCSSLGCSPGMLEDVSEAESFVSAVSAVNPKASFAEAPSVASDEEAVSEEHLDVLLAQVPHDESGRPLSMGSLLHSTGDCRPCAFLASQQRPCANGIRCLFCHFPHAPKRRIRLCRRKRIEMRAAVDAAVSGAGEQGIAPPPRFLPIAWSVASAHHCGDATKEAAAMLGVS